MKQPELKVKGNKAERELFTDLLGHYDIAKEDLSVRMLDFDKKDILFRSHINEADWPYQSILFDPRIFTSIYEKTARTFANKPRGRLIPREGGDILKAHINNEILSFQWDDNERADGMPMLAKWAMMDLNARKYGAAFGLVKWKFQRNKSGKIFYDAPNFVPLNNRDCLANPSYSTVKNWFQHREYLTIQDMESVNDAARSKPIYKNLDLLKQAIQEKSQFGGDSRASDYNIKNKSIKGLTDYLGRDSLFKVVEVITEYREDKWITFSPKHGIILREIDNPYEHGQLPIVQLKYYPIDDDLYGLSEIEPVEKLQRAINALICQYVDAINMNLYTPLKVRSTGGAVQMHTLEFGPGKKWLMNDPSTDVIPHQQGLAGVTEFTSTYRFMVSAMQEGLGDTSQGISNLTPGSDKKTATEVRDSAASRSVRDNFNLIFLGEALKKQMGFWLSMNQQYLFSNTKDQQKIIRIVGKDALKFFKGEGLDGYELSEDVTDQLAQVAEDGTMPNPQDFMTPSFPVQTKEGVVSKLTMDRGGQTGNLIVEPDDLGGLYDYIPDIESMVYPNQGQLLQAQQSMVDIALNPSTTQLLAQEGYKLNAKELIEDLFERYGSKDADKYFEKLQVQQLNDGQQGQIDPTGGVNPQAGQPGMEYGQYGGVQGNPQAMA